MKKITKAVIGMALFLAGYHHTHRHTQYMAAQSALTNGTTYVATPTTTPVHLKNSVAFRFIKPS